MTRGSSELMINAFCTVSNVLFDQVPVCIIRSQPSIIRKRLVWTCAAAAIHTGVFIALLGWHAYHLYLLTV